MAEIKPIEQAARALCEELWSHNIIPIRGQGDLLIANAMFDLTKPLEEENKELRKEMAKIKFTHKRKVLEYSITLEDENKRLREALERIVGGIPIPQAEIADGYVAGEISVGEIRQAKQALTKPT